MNVYLKIFVTCFCLSGCATAQQPDEASAPSKSKTPNILFILADDLGISDISAFASHFTGKSTDELFYETPHMDRLAKNGIAFSQAYANPLCSPTRAAIMTGRNAACVGFTTATPFTPTYYNQNLPVPAGFNAHDVLEHKDNIQQPQAWINGRSNTGLDPGLTILPEVLATHHSVFLGKWHLGGHGVKQLQPRPQGFDEVLAWFDAGGSDYFPTNQPNRYSWPQGWNTQRPHFSPMNEQDFDVGDAGNSPHANYLTDDLTDRAVDFIKRYSQDTKLPRKPFFLHFCHFAVHTPLQAPADLTARLADKPQRGTLGHTNATYAAMVKKLDDSVGCLMAVLEETGLAENTLVILASDNGGAEYTRPAATDNAPFKGGKGTMYEGGVRVPLVFYLPGKYEGGSWCDQIVSALDFLPTLAALTGNDVPSEVEGMNLLPILDDPQAASVERTLIWHYPFNVIVKHPNNRLPLTPHSGMRKGDLKLLWDWHGKLELYDLANDPYEQHDLAATQPERTTQMFQQLRHWLKDNVSPQYMPKRNHDYHEEQDKRPYPFIDLSGDLTR